MSCMIDLQAAATRIDPLQTWATEGGRDDRGHRDRPESTPTATSDVNPPVTRKGHPSRQKTVIH